MVLFEKSGVQLDQLFIHNSLILLWSPEYWNKCLNNTNCDEVNKWVGIQIVHQENQYSIGNSIVKYPCTNLNPWNCTFPHISELIANSYFKRDLSYHKSPLFQKCAHCCYNNPQASPIWNRPLCPSIALGLTPMKWHWNPIVFPPDLERSR